jgi:hypothetical protein
LSSSLQHQNFEAKHSFFPSIQFLARTWTSNQRFSGKRLE